MFVLRPLLSPSGVRAGALSNEYKIAQTDFADWMSCVVQTVVFSPNRTTYNEIGQLKMKIVENYKGCDTDVRSVIASYQASCSEPLSSTYFEFIFNQRLTRRMRKSEY